MATDRDLYHVLGVSRSASESEIKSAYRKLARELHPDVNKAPDAQRRFEEVVEAYEILSDPEKRGRYDRFGTADPAAAGFGGGGGRSGTYTWSNVGGAPGGGMSAEDVGSIFEEVFGVGGGGGFGGPRGARPGRAGARSHAPPRRGRDVEHEIHVSFLTAIQGGREALRVRRGGETRSIDVTIPPGIEEGRKLRVRGEGEPSPGGGPPGALLLTVHVGEHPHFRRDGLDLSIEVPISVTEAILGTTVRVPLPRGSVEMKIPPGTSSGTRLRVRGRGIVPKVGAPGDFHVVPRIVPPRTLTDDERAHVEALAQTIAAPRTGPPWTTAAEDVAARSDDEETVA